MTNARDKANIPVLNFASKGIDDNADATAITIDSSENVGIKNTTPSNFNASARQLVVGNGSGDNGITIFAGTSNNSSLFLADGTVGTNGYRGSINYLHNGDALTLHANATETMRLSNGKVGIGLTNPSETLEVQSSVTTKVKAKTTTSSAIGGFEAWNNSSAYMKIYSYGSSASGSDFGGVANANIALFEGQGVSNVAFSTWGNAGGSNPDFIFAPQRSQKVIIKSDGKVGIGTSSPSEKLDVSGTVKATQFVGGGLNPYRNIIINGDMSIAQRATSKTGITSSTFATIDRWGTGASSAGTWTQSQSTDVPTGQGFATSLKMDCTTAQGTLGASDRLQIYSKFEGQNLQHLKKGTSSAESTTMSFWVKSNKTGTYTCELYDNDNNRHIAKSYTISSANTWEKKTLTFAGDTSGAFDNNTGESFAVYFWLVAGSSFNSGTLATSWAGINSANRAGGQVNLSDNTANEWYVTGVQLEAGTSASDFEFLPVDVNLQRCQRYFHKWVAEHVYANIAIGKVQSGKNARGVYQTFTKMRTSPSLSADGNFRMVASGEGTGTGSDISVIRSNGIIHFMNFVFSGGTDSTSNQACEMGANNDADAEIAFSAEF